MNISVNALNHLGGIRIVAHSLLQEFLLFYIVHHEDLAVRSPGNILSSTPDPSRHERGEQTGIRFSSVLVKYLPRSQARQVAHQHRYGHPHEIVPHVGDTVQVELIGVVYGAEN